MLGIGVVATAVDFAVAFTLPEKTPNFFWNLAYSVWIYYYAGHVFGVAFDEHIANGGATGAWWQVVSVSTSFLAVSLGIFFTALYAYVTLVSGA